MEIPAYREFQKDALADVESVQRHMSRLIDILRTDFIKNVPPTKRRQVGLERDEADTMGEGEERVYTKIREHFALERDFIEKEYVKKFKDIRDRAADHVRLSWERREPEVKKWLKGHQGQVASEEEAAGHVAQHGLIDAPGEPAWDPGMPTPKNEQKKEGKHLYLNYLDRKWDWVVD